MADVSNRKIAEHQDPQFYLHMEYGIDRSSLQKVSMISNDMIQG